jgi:hypothetical protein
VSLTHLSPYGRYGCRIPNLDKKESPLHSHLDYQFYGLHSCFFCYVRDFPLYNICKSRSLPLTVHLTASVYSTYKLVYLNILMFFCHVESLSKETRVSYNIGNFILSYIFWELMAYFFNNEATFRSNLSSPLWWSKNNQARNQSEAFTKGT